MSEKLLKSTYIMIKYTIRFRRFHFRHLYRLLFQIDHDIIGDLLVTARHELFLRESLTIDLV